MKGLWSKTLTLFLFPQMVLDTLSVSSIFAIYSSVHSLIFTKSSSPKPLADLSWLWVKKSLILKSSLLFLKPIMGSLFPDFVIWEIYCCTVGEIGNGRTFCVKCTTAILIFQWICRQWLEVRLLNESVCNLWYLHRADVGGKQKGGGEREGQPRGRTDWGGKATGFWRGRLSTMLKGGGNNEWRGIEGQEAGFALCMRSCIKNVLND